MTTFKTLHSRPADSVITVPDLATLTAIVDPQEGDVRYVESEGSIYTYNGSWVPVGGGVVTPGSSTDNAVVRWDGTGADTVQDSVVTISDTGVVAGASIDADSNTITNIENADIKAAAAIDATKIANGTVDNTSFQHLSGATSNIQTQLDNKVDGPASSTDNRLVRWDGTSGVLVQDSAATLSDAGALSGLTQLDVDNVRTNGNTVEATSGNLNLTADGDVVIDAAADSVIIQSTSTVQLRSNADFVMYDNDNSNYVRVSVPSSILTNRTPQIPDLPGNFVLTEGTQTLENKTIVAADNTITTAASGNLTSTELNNALAELQSDIDSRESSANKGVAGGYASLDGGGKVPSSQLPAALMSYEGTWNASTNTPTLADGVGDAGQVYTVSVAGTQDLGSGNITFGVGDWAIYNGSIWEKSDNVDDVTSVNGYNGDVVLAATDVGAVAEMGTVIDNRIVRTDGTTGGLIQQSGITLTDDDEITGVTSLTIDSSAYDVAALSVTAKNIAGPSFTQALRLEYDETSTQISRRYYDGFALHQEINAAALSLDMGSNSLWKLGSGLTLWQGRYLIDQTDAAETYNERLSIGASTYATSADPLTTQYLELVTWAWNGTNGSSISTVGTLRLTQQSATNNDAEFDILLGGVSRLNIDADGGVNMDFDGKTASNTSRITVPQDTKANLDALTRKEGTIVYANDEDSLYVDNGTDLVAVGAGSGSGSGEKNYITNPSAASAITGWTNVGDLDVARTDTASELPREYTTGTGIKITADANTQSTADYVYYDFTLDDVDLNKKLKIQWAQKQTGSYVASDLAVIITTQADRTTALHTPETTNIPAYDGVFQTSFDSGSTATLSLVIRATTDMATDAGIVISDVIVGPGSIQAVPAIGTRQSYTPTSTWVTNSTHTGWYRRVGDKAEFEVQIVLTGAPTSATLDINMPSGMTIDNASVPNPGALGQVIIYDDAGGSGSSRIMGYVGRFTSTSVRIYALDDLAATDHYTREVNATTPITFANNDRVLVNFTVPIAEWAGAPNYAGSNDVEYAWNSDTSNATNTTAFAYGPGGVVFGSYTVGLQKRVRFLTPIQPTDVIWVEVFDPTGVGTWLPAHMNRDGSFAYVRQGSVGYGMYLSAVNSTDINVEFSQYARPSNSASYAAAGDSWGTFSTRKWRVVKAKAGAAVGFGIAQNGKSGLINYYKRDSNSGTFSGMTTSPTISADFVRSGDQVTMRITASAVNLTKDGSAGAMVLSGLVPDWARPTGQTDTTMQVVINNVRLLGYVRVTTGGNIEIYTAAFGNIGSATTNCGVVAGAVASWIR